MGNMTIFSKLSLFASHGGQFMMKSMLPERDLRTIEPLKILKFTSTMISQPPIDRFLVELAANFETSHFWCEKKIRLRLSKLARDGTFFRLPGYNFIIFCEKQVIMEVELMYK